MAELKFRNDLLSGKTASPSACSCASPSAKEERPRWAIGTVSAGNGLAHKVSTELSGEDVWEHVRCRTSAFRESYSVKPGLYAVGEPNKGSDVFVSANYKLSFDHLRAALKGMNCWVLVLDTKGINVWCAAGKGTFGTDELVNRVTLVDLRDVVDHKNIIVPQLGAVGVSGHVVRRATGFRVLYGPVYAKDIPAYVASGYKATPVMREVRFPLLDRLVLTPMEINPAMKKYYLWYALAIMFFFGFEPSGIIFRDAVSGGLPFLGLGLVSVVAGGFFTPVLLPWIPFRSFAVKGWLMGLLAMVLASALSGFLNSSPPLPLVASFLFFPAASSYIALQFTGSTTFTGMSGVKKELKISIPLYIVSVAISIVVLIFYKAGQWGTL